MNAVHNLAIAAICLGPGAAVSALMVLIGNWSVRRRELARTNGDADVPA